MADQERPLPKPPTSAFGRRKPSPEQENQELIADRMAEAAARGGLEEFLDRELPDSEHARALARMMMGLTGMMPQHAGTATAPSSGSSSGQPDQLPEAIRRAVQSSDVQGLIELLREEQQRRTGEGGASSGEAEHAQPGQELAPEEQETLATLAEIAKTNQTSLEWVVLRALKLYIREYQKTGRM